MSSVSGNDEKQFAQRKMLRHKILMSALQNLLRGTMISSRRVPTSYLNHGTTQERIWNEGFHQRYRRLMYINVMRSVKRLRWIQRKTGKNLIEEVKLDYHLVG